MSVELVTFPNGRVKLIHENYVFVKQKELSGGKISWECSQRRNVRSCKAKIQTVDGIFHGRTNVHTCSLFGHPERVAGLKARVNMLTQAANSEDRPHAIVGACTQNMTENAMAFLPSVDTMKRGIRR